MPASGAATFCKVMDLSYLATTYSSLFLQSKHIVAVPIHFRSGCCRISSEPQENLFAAYAVQKRHGGLSRPKRCASSPTEGIFCLAQDVFKLQESTNLLLTPSKGSLLNMTNSAFEQNKPTSNGTRLFPT